MKIIKYVLLLPYNVCKLLIDVLTNIRKSLQYTKMKTYFPEEKRKSVIKRFFEIMFGSFSKEWPERYYNLYAFDLQKIKEKEKKEYIGQKEFWDSLEIKNGLVVGNNNLCECSSQLYLLRDKYAFYHFMSSHNIKVPKVYCLLIDGKIYDGGNDEVSLNDLQKMTNYFIKDLNGQCGSFVKHISNYDELKNCKTIQKGKYIIQETITQSKQMEHINPESVNTLRIITINKDGKPYVFSSILRVGTKNTGENDNWSRGGLAIGINKGGRLKKYGFYKPKYGTKTDKHPDTNYAFDNVMIEKYEEACNLVLKAHKLFYGVHSIGWDVSITNEGPIIIEGNDNWAISLLQACNGGLKKQWQEAIS